MFGLSFWEIGVVFIVALLVLGPAKLPAFTRMIGKGLRTLRSASSDLRGALAAPLKEIQEPLNELRKDVYESMHAVGKELERSQENEPNDDTQNEVDTNECPEDAKNRASLNNLIKPAKDVIALKENTVQKAPTTLDTVEPKADMGRSSSQS